ncbi:MAG: hypothetical protein EDM77_11905 [Candidatus Jettenia sp. AMX1]|nr:MAG: hypothetical protein EDM77_11905 [Candidatus Jettenia sp. AMX1]
MNFSELISRQALQSRMHSTIRLLHNGASNIQKATAGDARADKAACEIALLFWGLNRHGYFSVESNTVIQSLLNLIEQRLRSNAIIQGLLWKPSRAFMLCMGTALLNKLGRHNTKFDNIARAAWRKLFLDSSERSPFQLLEVKWSSQILGVNIPLNIPDDSLLHRKSSPLMMNADDGYAFTHSVFYTTDCCHPLPLTTVPNDIWETIESGIMWSLLRFDFDLLGEFLLTAFYCRMPYTPIFYIGLSALFLTWDVNGFVPDRELSASELTSSGIFYGIYHANIVAALLSSELMKHKMDYDREAMPLLVSSASFEALSAKCSSVLSKFNFDKNERFHHKFMSASALLENVLGRRVTEKLVSVLGDGMLSHAYPDLLIGYGLTYQDFAAVLVGVSRSLDKKRMSPTMACAIEWLVMATEIHELATDSNHDGIEYSLNIT